jgi:hypothetical protein
MDTIFTIKNREIERLTSKEAVIFFRSLLLAEARRLGIPPNKINISLWENVPDGGIDASVKEVESDIIENSGLIKAGQTSYQFKTGHSFKPWQPNQIKEELFGLNKGTKKEYLGESVCTCLDKDGTYVLICFGLEFSNTQQKKAINNLIDYFKECGYKNAKVEVWGQSTIIAYTQIYPSLVLNFKGFDKFKFHTFKSWSIQDDMKKEFKAGKPQRELIKSLRREIRGNNQAVHVRLCGEPGIGKTRLLLEAVSVEDLSSLVIYCDSANKFRDSYLMNEIVKEDNNFSCILVIDECDSNNRSYIWNNLKHLGSRIKVISIYYENEERPSGNILYFDTIPLEKEQISDIIQGYNIPKDQADRWSGLCSGSPRVAHVIGWNLKNNPEDILKPLDTVNIWDRYIVGSDNPDTDDVKQRKLVLQYISLFKKFGFGNFVMDEAKAIAKIIEKSNPQINWVRFQQIIQKLKARKILQGEVTLYLTPKALHIQLWREWWNSFGSGFDFKDFSEDLTDPLREWFYDMFKYAAESEVASKTVEKLLGVSGPFQKDDYLRTRLGSNFFLALTEANPKSALKCLQVIIGSLSREKLQKFSEGRRSVVWSLQRIAVWRELFPEAARLLLALGEAENESYSNNASGVFMDLFSPGPDRVAPTGASLDERFPVLQESFNSNSKEKRLLALGACDKALKTGRFSRMVGPEYQGLKEAQLWKPKNRQEIIDYYKHAWQLVFLKLDNFQKVEQEKAINILLSKAQGLTYIPELAEMIISDIAKLSDKPYSNKEEILKKIESILYFTQNKLPANIKHLWELLRDNLTGKDFPSLMKRYVGMDLIEDKFDEDRKRIDKVGEYIDNLVERIITENSLLESELLWLVTQEAANGFRFGYKLGKKDKNFIFLPMLLDAQRKVIKNKNASDYFLGGYLRALYEIKPDQWESLLDKLAKDKDFASWVPNLTWRSGITNRAALRILNLAKKGIVNAVHLRIFGYGSIISNISEKIFKQWIEFLLESSDDAAASIALDLYDFFYIRSKDKYKLPKELTFKLLIHPSLYKKLKQGRRNQMDDFHWTEIGIKFIQLYPDRSLKIADMIFKHFGKDGSILEGYQTETHKIINSISQKYPKEIWKYITKYLGPPIDSRAFNIKEWLRGEGLFENEKGQLNTFSADMVWEWVDKDIEKRAWYLATFVPKVLFRQEGKICWARELLARYGTREDVRDNLAANFSTEGWWGPASLHFQQKKEKLLTFRKEEDNKNVIKWIDDYVEELKRQIEYKKIDEERMSH